MKIKKKRYKKELKDAYWRGVDDGIKYALNDPERAKRISGAQLRAQIETIDGAILKLGRTLAKIFERGGTT